MTTDSQPGAPGQIEAALKAPLGRRRFLKQAAAGAGAMGVAAIVPAFLDSDAAREGAAPLAVSEAPVAGGPVMIYVRNVATGEAVIIVDETESVVIDPGLVAQIQRAQGRHLA